MRRPRRRHSVALMTQRAIAVDRRTYLVEQYRAGVAVEEPRRSASRVRDTVGQDAAGGQARRIPELGDGPATAREYV